MKKITLLVSLASISCAIYAMEGIEKRLNIIKLAQNENHFSSRTVGDITYKPEILVMHYTAEDLRKTIELFTGPDTAVSAHYIIAQEGNIFRTIEESNAAHHAGLSYWRGITGTPEGSRTGALNLHSLGIELVNMGYKEKESQPEGIFRGDRQWYQFDERQIEASIKLSRYLVRKYKIKPEDVVAHGDIAPKRKVDPGPLFPWQIFAEQGISAWPDGEIIHTLDCFTKAEENDDDPHAIETWTLNHLHHWGYKKPDDQDLSVPEAQRASDRDIIKAFQMHFKPYQIDGKADIETATILKALLCEYKDAHTQCPCKQ
jgi:N-acetylmuramoyl-L-alanine amidase